MLRGSPGRRGRRSRRARRSARRGRRLRHRIAGTGSPMHRIKSAGTVPATVTNSFAFEPVVGWEQLPDGLIHRDVSDVAVDASDRVFLLTRKDPRVIVYDRSG